ncbi:DDB1- and CUL4-associated factor 8-like isoform X2 [Rhodamnia argentea]|uniref:DDB1- and CUL4-associated factor 8-like isoform X2 n=1 Tax=Rhodamnia argentea TaxID=178133 RepID=A0A8B8NJY7_9MYRT|nr:DDB1- and CUL4-associated factor 8-like isoform X2 [Rhodamnia argentea]
MKKRPRTSLDQAVVDIGRREVGGLSARSFARRLAASEDLVLRLDVYNKLDGHRGCVNTVSFSGDGDIVISGSDDRHVKLWDWQTGKVKLSFHSGHHSNVFQAEIMPYTDDRSIVTCAADGEARHAQILEGGQAETMLLAKHQGRVHKLAIEPGSPHIVYTCAEDGLVQRLDLRSKTATELFTCQEVYRTHVGVVHLNAIAIDPRNPNLFVIGGSDEYARIYDIRNYKWNGSHNFGRSANYFSPSHLIGDAQVGITGLAFSDQSELLVSYNDEFIYLFTQEMGLGPDLLSASTKSVDSNSSEVTSPTTVNADDNVTPQVYKGHRNRETVKGVGFFGPKCEYVMSGSDCGRIFIWKKKGGQLIRVMAADKHVVNCIKPHPYTPALASSGIENDIKIWTPRAIERATLPTNVEELKPKARGWMNRILSSRDLLSQLHSLQRWAANVLEHGRETSSSSAARQELMELFCTLSANDDGSSYGCGDSSGPAL